MSFVKMARRERTTILTCQTKFQPGVEVMMDFGPDGIFNVWEAERVTGNPRNSVYIRAE